MLASVSFGIGILIAAFILAVTHRRETTSGQDASKPIVLGWWTLAFGLSALSAFGLAVLLSPTIAIPGLNFWLVSIGLAFAAVAVGVGSVIRRERHWPTWVGLAAGIAPALFWIAFAIGHFLDLR